MLTNLKNAKGSLSFGMVAGSEYDLNIFGEIGNWWSGITQDQFSEALAAAKNATRINVNIHSAGGDLFDGVFMYNALKQHPAEKVGSVLGLCASAATLPLLACSTRKMGNGTSFMIHRAMAGYFGYSDGFENVAKSLVDISNEAARLYSVETGQDIETVRAAMLAETWMAPDTAISLGYATGMLDAQPETAPALYADSLQTFKNIPESAKRFFNFGDSGKDPVEVPAETAPARPVALDILSMKQRLQNRKCQLKGF